MGYEYPFRGDDVPKNIGANYGYYSGGGEHYGLDINNGNKIIEGTNLYAPGSGTVVDADYDAVPRTYGAGYYITINMDDKYTLPGDEDAYVTYMHMQSMSTYKGGDRVSKSSIVGKVGNTGYSYGAHLHIGIFNVPKWISGNLSESNNPLRYYTQYKFTGIPEDRTEYDRDWRMEQEENLTYPRELYIIPGEIIRYIGEEDFDNWVKSTTSYEKCLMSCLDHFNISHETFLAILAENPLLEEDYSEELKQQILDYRTALK